MSSIDLFRVADYLRNTKLPGAVDCFVELFSSRAVACLTKWRASKGCGSCRDDLLRALSSEPQAVREFLRRMEVPEQQMEVLPPPPAPVLIGTQIVIDDTSEAYRQAIASLPDAPYNGIAMHVRSPGQVVLSFW